MAFYLVLFAAVIIGFFIQTIVGFAASLFAYPLLLLVMDFKEANAIFALYYFLFSIVYVYKNWRAVDKIILKELAPGIVIGLFMGLFLLQNLDSHYLQQALGVFSFVYAIYAIFSKKKYHLPTFLSVIIGFIGGIIAGLFAASSSVYAPYLDSRVKSPEIFRSTIIALLGIGNLLRFPLMFYDKILTPQIFLHSLIALPVFILTVYCGEKVYKKVSVPRFRYIVLFLLALSGVGLILR